MEKKLTIIVVADRQSVAITAKAIAPPGVPRAVIDLEEFDKEFADQVLDRIEEEILGVPHRRFPRTYGTEEAIEFSTAKASLQIGIQHP